MLGHDRASQLSHADKRHTDKIQYMDKKAGVGQVS